MLHGEFAVAGARRLRLAHGGQHCVYQVHGCVHELHVRVVVRGFLLAWIMAALIRGNACRDETSARAGYGSRQRDVLEAFHGSHIPRSSIRSRCCLVSRLCR